MKIDQPGVKADYDLKQSQQPVRSSPDSQNIRNASSVLQNPYAEPNAPQAPPAKPIVAKRSPTEESVKRQNGTNGKANVSTYRFFHESNSKRKRFINTYSIAGRCTSSSCEPGFVAQESRRYNSQLIAITNEID